MIFECRLTLVRGNVVGIIFRLLILKIWERIFPGKFQWERGKIWDPINSIMFFLLKPSILQYKPFFFLLELVRREHCLFRVPVREQA